MGKHKTGFEAGQHDYGAAPGTAASFGGHRDGLPVVSFQNVSKQYGSPRAVDGLTLDLRQGETVALLGPNGAGKSTSLDMLLALRKPTSGRIEMFGSDTGMKSGRVGAMLQSGGLMPEVTVRLRGQQGARLAGHHRAVHRDRAAARPLLRQRPPAGQFTPAYAVVKIGTDVIQNVSVPAGLPIGLVVWLGIFTALATPAVRCPAVRGTAETV